MRHVLSLAVLLLAQTVAAQAPAAPRAQPNHPAAARAQTYATEHNFPVRVVETGPANRRVARAFVPITQATFESFSRHFTETSPGIVLRYVDSNHHLAMALKPGDAYLWARNQPNYVSSYGRFEGGGYSIAVRLNALDHLRAWLAAREDPKDQLHRGGNCMEWLPNAEVGPGRVLFHELGLRRSKDGPNMRAKLLHAANDQVDVVGVHVVSLEQFSQMTDAQLLGNPPAGGVDDATR